jgi:membrane protein DedA with SNARE-associated domain
MEWLHDLVLWIVGIVGKWGYPGIVVMMFLESSCFPFPSEVVMIPAGYLAHQGQMNVWMAILMGVIGSWLGALFNYYLALALGRPLLLKWGKYLFISEKNFEKGEQFFQRHGEIGTFTGRLIPVVRQYISLPAGIARMNLARFLFWTGLGAGIWMAILVAIGYVAGQSEDLWKPYLKQATAAALAFCAVVVAAYVWWHRRKKRLTAATEG